MNVQTLDVWEKKQQQTAYAKVKLSAPGRYSFLSLLVPVRASDLPAPPQRPTRPGFGSERSFTTSVSQSSSPTGGAVSATVMWNRTLCVSASKYCGTQLDIKLGAQGGASWSVERTLI